MFGRATVTLGIGPHSSCYDNCITLYITGRVESRHIWQVGSSCRWSGLSANLECRSEMCCTRLAGNTGRKNDVKIAVCAPSHNFVGLYLCN